jgi:hypothetical protein
MGVEGGAQAALAASQGELHSCRGQRVVKIGTDDWGHE